MSFPWARLIYVVVVLAVVSFVVSALTGHSLLLTGLYELVPLAVAVVLVLVIGGMQRRRRQATVSQAAERPSSGR